MKYVIVHGIGNYNEGWLNKKKAAVVLGTSERHIIEYSYEDDLQGNNIKSYQGFVWDNLRDIHRYFYHDKVALEAQRGLIEILDWNPGCTVIAHSLGSVVAEESIRKCVHWGKRPVHRVYLGSPLGMRFGLGSQVRRKLDVEDKGNSYLGKSMSFWHKRDYVSGRIRGLGFNKHNQYKVNGDWSNPHDLWRYLNVAQYHMFLEGLVV